MATIPVIDALDRCKIALQYIAEMQSDRLVVLLELLLEHLEDAIGQACAELRQCTCACSSQPRMAPCSEPRGVLTLLSGSRQTPPSSAPLDAEGLDTEDEGSCLTPHTAPLAPDPRTHGRRERKN
jgi:hypothetical protein